MGTALCPEPCLYTSACLLQELIGEVTFPEEPMRKGEVTPAAWSLRPEEGRLSSYPGQGPQGIFSLVSLMHFHSEEHSTDCFKTIFWGYVANYITEFKHQNQSGTSGSHL
jgi:hypothetical protein